jgi:hypothetical protein
MQLQPRRLLIWMLRTAVEVVTDNGVANPRQMHAELMAAPCSWMQQQQRALR